MLIKLFGRNSIIIVHCIFSSYKISFGVQNLFRKKEQIETPALRSGARVYTPFISLV